MKVQIMGSAAAEGWPAIWCRCPYCQKARELGGKNLRSRSGSLVDEIFKFDWSMDTYGQALAQNVDLSKVEHLIFTHTHGDHYQIYDLTLRRPPYAHGVEPHIHIWGDRWAIEGVRERYPDYPEEFLHELQAFTSYDVGDATLTPLRAAHYPERGCFNYVFQRGGKTLFYGQDSGWYPEEHWEAQRQFTFDVVVLDCCGGAISGGSGHGDIEQNLRIKERMLKEGTATEETLFISNHFSHNGQLLHDELVARLAPHNILVAYDGMVVEV